MEVRYENFSSVSPGSVADRACYSAASADGTSWTEAHAGSGNDDEFTGQPIRFPQGDNQFTAVVAEVAPGGQVGRHMHPVPLFVYMLEGTLSIEMEGHGTHTFNAGDPELVEKVKKATNGGVDYAIEMAGSTRAFETAYRITRRGGTTVTAGLPPPSATWAMPSTNLVAEERTIKGSYIGTCVPSRDLPRYIDLYMQGRLPVDKLMSGHLKLEEINEGFDRLHEGKAVRQVVTF